MESTSGLSVAEILRALSKSKFLILSCTAVCLLCVLAYILFTKPVYEADASIRIDPSMAISLGLSDLVTPNGVQPGTGELSTEIVVLQSDGVALATLSRLTDSEFKSYAGFDKSTMNFNPGRQLLTKEQEVLLANFKAATTVKEVEETQIIAITFRDTNPQLAATILNHLVETYRKRSFDSRLDSVAQVTTWLSARMEELRIRAANAQKKLADFEQANDIVEVDATNNTTLDRLKLLNDRLTVAEGDRIIKEAQMRAAASGDPAVLASILPDANLQSLEMQLGTLSGQYAQMSTKFGPGYPPLADLKQQIAALKAKIAQDVSAISGHLQEEYDAASRGEAMLREVYNKETDKAYALNRNQAEYAVLAAEGTSSRDLYNHIQVKLEQAGVDAGLAAVDTLPVDAARVSAIPVAPKKALLIAFGLALGLVIGIIGALLRDSAADEVQSANQLEEVTGLHCLASIPHLAAASGPRGTASPGKASGALVSLSDPRSAAAESYRTLRNAVLLSSQAETHKTILVTSALHREGRSLTSANLAVVLAQTGRKVLLLDGDPQNPQLQSFFGIPSGGSSAQKASAETTYPSSFAPLDSLPNLHLLSSAGGVKFSAEGLDSSNLAAHVAAWKQNYDLIVIDSAPLLRTSDSMLLASWADTVVLVTRLGITPLAVAQRAKELLLRAHARVVGVIINDVDKKNEEFATLRAEKS